MRTNNIKMGGANTVPPAFNIGGTIHLFSVRVFHKRA